MVINMTDTGKIIKACRESLNWPRTRLAEMSGVSFDTIVNCERHSDCRVSTFEKLIDAMGYEIEVMKKDW